MNLLLVAEFRKSRCHLVIINLKTLKKYWKKKICFSTNANFDSRYFRDMVDLTFILVFKWMQICHLGQRASPAPSHFVQWNRPKVASRVSVLHHFVNYFTLPCFFMETRSSSDYILLTLFLCLPSSLFFITSPPSRPFWKAGREGSSAGLSWAVIICQDQFWSFHIQNSCLLLTVICWNVAIPTSFEMRKLRHIQ